MGSVQRVERAVGEHFADALCESEELTFVPFKSVKERDLQVRMYLEKLLISKHSFVDSPLGINRIIKNLTFSSNNKVKLMKDANIFCSQKANKRLSFSELSRVW